MSDEHPPSQKQLPRGVPRKRCPENMQQIYRRTPMPKCDFNCNFIEIALRCGCSPVNLLCIFRTHFLKNSSRRLLLTSQANNMKKIAFCFRVYLFSLLQRLYFSIKVMLNLLLIYLFTQLFYLFIEVTLYYKIIKHHIS